MRYVSSLVSTVQDLPVLGDISTVCTLECALLYRAVAYHTPEKEHISIATHLVLKGQYHKVTIEITHLIDTRFKNVGSKWLPDASQMGEERFPFLIQRL